MKKMDCKKIQSTLNKYIDNQISAKEKIIIETHIGECTLCRAVKEELEKLTEVYHQVPEVIPSEKAEEIFWERVRSSRKHRFIEKIRSLITQWDFIPVHYPVTVLFLIGLVMGILFGTVFNGIHYKDRLSSSTITYLALDRMDTIPYQSFTGVYLSRKTTSHKFSKGEH
jgi:Predicted integral membrane protein